jgi:phage shock protein A
MDDSLTLDDDALIQIETLETLIVWFNKSFQDELVASSDATTTTNNNNTTLTHLNLADGFLLYQAGTILSPEHFPQEDENTNKLVQALMESNSTTGNTNAPSQMWIKRSSLLKLFSKGLIEFFQDIAHIDIESHLSDHVDIVQVAKNDEMLGKVELMKLLLAASINSKEKQRYIEIIMGMDDEKQEQLMYVIQEFSEIARPMDDEDGIESEDDNNNSNNNHLDSDGNSEANNSNSTTPITKSRQSSDNTDDTRRSSFASSIGSDDSEDMQRSLSSPSNKRSNSSTSKQSTAAFNIVKHELEDLKLQYNKLNENHTGITKKYKELQATMRNNKAKEAAIKAEALNAEHTQELERLLERAEQNLMEVRATSAERQRDLQETAQRLADELDIANEKLQTLDKTELALNKAKQRLSEMASLKSQVKELEEQNTEYMEKMLQQEATVSVTVPQLKSQVERYKDKVVDLDSALTGKSARIMAQEKDISKLKEQIVELTKKKNSLHEQLDNAQLEIEQLKDEATDAGFGFSSSSNNSSNNNEDKETIARLERQVKALRMMSKKATAAATTTSGGDGSNDIHILKDELDDAIRSKDRFQSELMKSKTRIEELEQMVQQAGTSGENNTSGKVPSSPPPSTKMMDRLKQRNEKLSRQNNELKHEVMELEQKLVESTEANNNDGKANLEALLEEKDAVVKQLKNSLKEKETTCNQLSLEKEKLENYVKQALKATKMKYKVAAQSLKENILKKDETIVQLSNKVEILSRNREHMKQQHRTEERLVMSALYEVGLEMQRRMVTNGGVSGNVSGPSSNNMSSWLNKRRAQKRS